MRVSNFAYCCECREDMEYYVVEQPRYYPHPIKDFNVCYTRKACLCKKCFTELFVPSYRDANNNAIQEAIQKELEV